MAKGNDRKNKVSGKLPREELREKGSVREMTSERLLAILLTFILVKFVFKDMALTKPFVKSDKE